MTVIGSLTKNTPKQVTAQDWRPGLLSVSLVQISFSDRLLRVAVVKNKSAIGQIAISPVGTAENSPGRSPG